MKLLFSLLLLLCSCCAPVRAQREADNWFFGDYAGLAFGSGCQPLAIQTSRMSTQEGCASLSDKRTGQLLFYTDAFTVWNRDNESMPGSLDNDIRPGVNRDYVALSQGALLVPDPGDSLAYYLFSLIQPGPDDGAYQQPGVLRYSRINMRLGGGKGDIASSEHRRFLSDRMVGRLTAVRHTNGRDYWLITHQWQTNAFLIYPVTESGVGKADTVRIGSSISEPYGFLRASPNGRRLACSSRTVSAQPVDLFDFDATTGRISNYVNLGLVRAAYGLSFSPDNTKLYVSNATVVNPTEANLPTELIRQYNLNAGSTDAVVASGKSVVYGNPSTNIQLYKNRYSDFYAPSLQLGPDGRLYGSSNANAGLCDGCGQRLLVINKPNEVGFACDIQVQVAELGRGLVGNASDLPNFMQHYFDGLIPDNCPFDDNDRCTTANIQITPNPAAYSLQITVSDLCFAPYTLRIVNMAGQELGTYAVSTAQSPLISIVALAGGMYIAELRFADRTLVKRFVKN